MLAPVLHKTDQPNARKAAPNGRIPMVDDPMGCVGARMPRDPRITGPWCVQRILGRGGDEGRSPGASWGLSGGPPVPGPLQVIPGECGDISGAFNFCGLDRIADNRRRCRRRCATLPTHARVHAHPRARGAAAYPSALMRLRHASQSMGVGSVVSKFRAAGPTRSVKMTRLAQANRALGTTSESKPRK